MKIEEKLRSAMREYTDSVRPDPSAWYRIDAGMGARPPRSRRPAAMSLVAGAAILALLAVRLIADEPLGKVDLTTPIPALPTTPPIDPPTSSPTSNPAQKVEGRWAKMPTPPTKDPFSTSAWTGREFLLWRGSGPEPGRGLAYDPSTRRWRELPRFVVGGRFGAPAVWTGEEMIVWGGALDESGGEDRPPYTDGAAYDPTTNRWRRIAESPLYGGWDHQAVWTGAEMLVWGSRPQDDSIVHEFAAYNPSTDIWRELPTGPLGPRDFPNVVWTGREMLVWGGAFAAEGRADGAAFDPGTESWRAIPEAPLSPRRLAMAVWTGSELFVWGGKASDESDLADGARFSPATNEWTKVAPAPLTPRHFGSIVATPKGVFLWGGTGKYVEGEQGPPYFNDGAVYDPKTDTWRTLPKAPLGPREGNAEVAYTGRTVIIWGGLTPYPDTVYSDGATFTFSE